MLAQYAPGQQKLLLAAGAVALALLLAVIGTFVKFVGYGGGLLGGDVSQKLTDFKGAFFLFPWAIVAAAAAIGYQWVRTIPLERRRGLTIGLLVAMLIGEFEVFALGLNATDVQQGVDASLSGGFYLLLFAHIIAFVGVALLWRADLTGGFALNLGARPAGVAPPPAALPRFASPVACTATADAPLYSQPNTASLTFGSLRRGDAVQALGRGMGMLEVQLPGGQLGYVEERFVVPAATPAARPASPAPAPPPPTTAAGPAATPPPATPPSTAPAAGGSAEKTAEMGAAPPNPEG